MSVERALSQRSVITENSNLRAQLDRRVGLDNVIGRDPHMMRVYDMINSVADTRATVLVTGESGTGKSMIARAIHRRSSRAKGPFVEVACGALPENLLESELFGHVAGSFTGATGEKMGKFLQADGGTIFLDEIGTASPAMQVKLLRVLQELKFEPVGGTKTFEVDVRVILATNEDLASCGLPRPLPAGFVLPHQRDQHRAAAAALARERHSAVGPFVPGASPRRCPPHGEWLFARRRWSRSSGTTGQAMFASCRTSSSGPCCWARSR